MLLNRKNEVDSRVIRIIEWSSVLIEKLTVSQQMKKLHNFYGMRMFNTMFTRTLTGLNDEPDVSSLCCLSCCVSYGIYAEEVYCDNCNSLFRAVKLIQDGFQLVFDVLHLRQFETLKKQCSG